MASPKTSVTWKGGLEFEASSRVHRWTLDASPESGGTDRGPTPKEAFLSGLCGCTAMDVAALLKSMHQPLQALEVRAETESTTGTPAVFKRIILTFDVRGEGVSAERLKRAVELSQTKYCGVSAMLASQVPMEYEIFLNGQPVGKGKPAFSSNPA